MPVGPNDPTSAYDQPSQGVVTLDDGAAVVLTPHVTADSLIFLGVQELGTVTVPSALTVTGRTLGTSFSIGASQATDTSTVAWHIVEPAADAA